MVVAAKSVKKKPVVETIKYPLLLLIVSVEWRLAVVASLPALDFDDEPSST